MENIYYEEFVQNILFSAIIFPRIKKIIKIGTSVIERIAPVIIANDFVNAKGVNNLPSCPVKAK